MAVKFKDYYESLGVPRGAGKLVGDVAVPIEAQPAEAVEDRRDRGFGRAGAVGVLDAKQVLAAMVLGEQPVEERSAGAADVDLPARRR